MKHVKEISKSRKLVQALRALKVTQQECYEICSS